METHRPGDLDNLGSHKGDEVRQAVRAVFWTALHALDGYLTGQSAWLADCAERHRAGLRVGAATIEGTANVLVNRRMNTSQQMRWPRRGADLPQVRGAVHNGTLGSGFGQKCQPANDPGRAWRPPPEPQSCGSPSDSSGRLTAPAW